VSRIPVPKGFRAAENFYRPEVITAIENTLLSFGSFRAWPVEAQFNFLMSLLGTLAYRLDIRVGPQPWQRPAISATNDTRELVECLQFLRGKFDCDHTPAFGQLCACQKVDALLTNAGAMPAQVASRQAPT
jgi:hypothetical protein